MCTDRVALFGRGIGLDDFAEATLTKCHLERNRYAFNPHTIESICTALSRHEHACNIASLRQLLFLCPERRMTANHGALDYYADGELGLTLRLAYYSKRQDYLTKLLCKFPELMPQSLVLPLSIFH